MRFLRRNLIVQMNDINAFDIKNIKQQIYYLYYLYVSQLQYISIHIFDDVAI